jgi:hypothetical protein
MTRHSIFSQAAAVLPVVAIALALANWRARPEAPWAWVAVIAMSVVMLIVRHGAQLAVRRSSGDDASVRSLAAVTGGVVCGALTMIVKLAMTLANVYGVVDNPDLGRRPSMVIVGVYLAALGNAMPRMLPPVSLMQCNGARIQAFQRFVGWTWALCGLGVAAVWLTLPIAMAGPASTALVAVAMILTFVQLLRLRKVRLHTPRLN